ncbi:MAG TPA: ABC transporter ATP-binding protein, partial [Enterococcus sp.]|nr:ABC transporter ATP-binding protein [Enterococcus sp.]
MNDVLTLKNLHHTFEKGTINENHVLKGINLSLKPGDFVTIIGGNGAGKSTLLNSIAGTFSVDQGQILLNEKNITKKSVVERS